jgi:hypothetical protein
VSSKPAAVVSLESAHGGNVGTPQTPIRFDTQALAPTAEYRCHPTPSPFVCVSAMLMSIELSLANPFI